MSSGSIPVFVARDFVKPFTEQVNWSAFSFTFSPDEVPDMLRTLRSVPPEELQQMQVIKRSMCFHKMPHIIVAPYDDDFALFREQFDTT